MFKKQRDSDFLLQCQNTFLLSAALQTMTPYTVHATDISTCYDLNYKQGFLYIISLSQPYFFIAIQYRIVLNHETFFGS